MNAIAHGMNLGLRTMNSTRDGIHAIADGMNLASRTINSIGDGMNLVWRSMNSTWDRINVIADGMNLAWRTFNSTRDGIHLQQEPVRPCRPHARREACMRIISIQCPADGAADERSGLTPACCTLMLLVKRTFSGMYMM
jgi:hypothetical protein